MAKKAIYIFGELSCSSQELFYNVVPTWMSKVQVSQFKVKALYNTFMYTIKIAVKKSSIEGKGVFAIHQIEKNKIVWLFTRGHDLLLSPQEYQDLSELNKENIEKIGYLSPWSGYWVYPPQNDPARFTNHSKKNNLTAVFDAKVSTEPYFIANRVIQKDEEITNNYLEFDKLTQDTKPKWTS